MTDILRNSRIIDTVRTIQALYENDLSKRGLEGNPLISNGLVRLSYADNLKLALKVKTSGAGMFQIVGCKGGMPIIGGQEQVEYIVANPIELGGMKSVNTCETFDSVINQGCTVIEDNVLDTVRDSHLNLFRQTAINTINHLTKLAVTGTVNILGQDAHVEPLVANNHLIALTDLTAIPAPTWDVTSTDIRASFEGFIKPQIFAVNNGQYANFANLRVFMNETTWNQTLGINSVIGTAWQSNPYQTIADQFRLYPSTFLGNIVVSEMGMVDENGVFQKLFQDGYIYITTSNEPLMELVLARSQDPRYQTSPLQNLTNPLAQAVGILEASNDPRIPVPQFEGRPSETLIYEIGAKMAASAILNPNAKLFSIKVTA